MGDRSRVIAAVSIENKRNALKIIDDWDDITELGENFYMQAYSWKWYPSYDKISEFEEFIAELEDDGCLLVVREDGAIVSEVGPIWNYGIEAYTKIVTPFD